MSPSMSDESRVVDVMTPDVGPPQNQEPWPKVVILILNYCNPEDTIECVESFRRLSYPNFEIIVVDNKSEDDSCMQIGQRVPESSLICTDSNRGYAGGNNKGIEHALHKDANLLLIVNNDTQVLNRDFLPPLVRVFADSEVGIAGPRVVNPGDYVQETILSSPTLVNYIRNSRLWQKLFPRMRNYSAKQEVEAVSGVCWLARAEVFQTVGLLDEEYFMYAEEQDYCYRVRKAGWKVLYVPIESILHKRAPRTLASRQRTYLYSKRNYVLFVRKHFGLFQALVIALIILTGDTLRAAAHIFRHKQRTEPAFYSADLLRALISEMMAVLRWQPR
jgi:GT2 family glycosyltransferase